MAHALDRWNHVPIERISTHYFIAFPCLPIAQPLIVMWFLRAAGNEMLLVLCAYDGLLLPTNALLRWWEVPLYTEPSIAVGNPGNVMLPARRSLAERYRSRFFAVMSGFQKTASQRARIPACRTVLPSYSPYAINYSI
jgi:hypothetical protein